MTDYQQQLQQYFLAPTQTQKERRARLQVRPTDDEQGLFYKGTVGSLQAQKKRLNNKLSQQMQESRRLVKQLSQQKKKNMGIQEEYINRIDELTLEQYELKELLARTKGVRELRKNEEKMSNINEQIILAYKTQNEHQATQIEYLMAQIVKLNDTINTMTERADLCLKQELQFLDRYKNRTQKR